MQTQSKTSLEKLVREEVKAQMRKYAMAGAREAYIDSLVDELSPEKDDARRRIETAKFTSSYKLSKTVPLPNDAHEEFMLRVWEIVDIMFPSHRSEE